jgi:hypothetical protein
MHHSPSFSLAFKTFQIMNLNTIIIRINKAIPILKSQFGYPGISILSSLSSSINNSINIKNVINKNNMMMMNASAASFHTDLHAAHHHTHKNRHLRRSMLKCLGAETTTIGRRKGTRKILLMKNPKPTMSKT